MTLSPRVAPPSKARTADVLGDCAHNAQKQSAEALHPAPLDSPLHPLAAPCTAASTPLTAPYFFGLPVLGQPTIARKVVPAMNMRPPCEYNARFRAFGAAVPDGLDLITLQILVWRIPTKATGRKYFLFEEMPNRCQVVVSAYKAPHKASTALCCMH
jgi:hypothetical protein